MQNLEFKVYSFDELSKQMLYDILAHRAEVFILGQRAIYRDLDGFDQKARHMVALRSGKIVGYVRLLPAGLHYDGYEENVFGRLSVLESERGQGLGAELVCRACAALAELGDTPEVRISAMAYLEEFYGRLGFVRVSDVFDIQGVAHVTMLYVPDR